MAGPVIPDGPPAELSTPYRQMKSAQELAIVPCSYARVPGYEACARVRIYRVSPDDDLDGPLRSPRINLVDRGLRPQLQWDENQSRWRFTSSTTCDGALTIWKPPG
jgi:hypothetical protein